MSADFGYCWRTVRLYCPMAPTFLAREWVNAAYKQLLAARRWGFMRVQAPVVYDGLTPYVTMPADFASFKVVVDETRQVKLCTTHSLDELLTLDPGLSATGPAGALIAATPDPTTGRARYRLYPSGTAGTFTAVYHRQGDRLDDTDVFPGVLADGGEVLVAGALAQAALWPGTGEKTNPYFNAGLAESKRQEFQLGIQMLSLRDDEQYPDDLWDSWPEADCGCLSGGDPRTSDVSVYSY